MHASPVAHLMVQIVVIVALSRVAGRALRRVGQPPVIGEILAGIVLGPSLLGWWVPGLVEAIFPESTLPALSVTAQIGLVFFMFLVGLEFDPSLLVGRRRAALVISQVGILVPFALGAVLAIPLQATLAPQGVRTSSFALFFGVSLSITALPVLARILGEQGLLRTPVGALALASAAVNDVTAWCVLALIVGLVQSDDLSTGLLTTGAALLLYAAIMWKVVRPALARVGPRGPAALSRDLIAGALMLLLVSATATELIGIHALFGGFVLGAVVPRGPLSHALVEKLEDFVTIVLLPLFFAVSGLRTELGLLSTVQDWAMCGAIVAVASLGKYGGTLLAARWIGLPGREAHAIGILMNTRGLMELIVLNIGLDLGVISPRLFTMMVFMALATTFLTAPLLRLVLRRGPISPGVDQPRRTEGPILLCLADPASAASLVDLAGSLLREGSPPALALHVVPPDRDSDVMPGVERRPAHAPVVAARERAGARGIELEVLSFVSGSVARDIAGIARSREARMVLMGVHRTLMGGDLVGGVVGEVMERAGTMVGVLCDRGLPPVGRALLLQEEGAHADAAAVVAERLAGGGWTLVAHPVPPDATEAAVRALLQAEAPDLVVVGLTGRWGSNERRRPDLQRRYPVQGANRVPGLDVAVPSAPGGDGSDKP